MSAEDESQFIDYDDDEQGQETKEDDNKAVKKWVYFSSLLPNLFLLTFILLLPSTWTIISAPHCSSALRGHYVGMHTSNFRDFILKPELIQAVVECGFEHPSEG